MNDHVGTFHLFTGRRQYGQGTIFCGKCAPHVIVFLPVPACILISCLFLSVFIPYSEKFPLIKREQLLFIPSTVNYAMQSLMHLPFHKNNKCYFINFTGVKQIESKTKV